MISPLVLGALIVGVPAALVAFIALRRQPRGILLFALALILVGLGYLGSTGALVDIADTVMGTATPAVPEPSPVAP
jgi:dipeptide/tripeptide permease